MYQPFQSKIVGGENADILNFPYQISFQTRFGSHKCGGSILDETHVVTAAHCCTEGLDNEQIKAGITLLSENGETRDIVNEHRHESYGPFKYNNDICILTVSNKLNPKILCSVNLLKYAPYYFSFLVGGSLGIWYPRPTS